VLLGNVPLVEGLFFGLKAAVLAIVLHAVQRIGKRALKNNVMLAIAAASFVAIFFLGAPFPAIVLAAGVIGYLGGRAGLVAFKVGGGHGAGSGPNLSDAESTLGEGVPAHARPDIGWSLRISAVFLALWLVPVVALVAALGWDNVFSRIALFFSQMAVVTFGGAYAVLAYVAQQAVETYGWLRPGEMLDGLGMAETTPGPLIMVVQFVGFLGVYRDAGGLDPLLAATLGAVLTTWVALLPLDLPRRAFHRAPARQCSTLRGAVRDHGCRGRRDPEPRDLVRAACAVRHGRGDPGPRPDARRSGLLQRQLGRDCADGGCYAGDIQVRRIDGLGAGRLRAGGNWSQDNRVTGSATELCGREMPFRGIGTQVLAVGCRIAAVERHPACEWRVLGWENFWPNDRNGVVSRHRRQVLSVRF
jgi:chromate transport protein ChrA